MEGNAVHAVTNFRFGVRNVFRMQSAIYRLPGLSTVICAESACSGDRDEHPLRIDGIKKYRMEAHTTRAGLPLRSRHVAAEAGKFFPRLSAVGRLEQCRILCAGIHSVRIIKGGFQVPYAFEFPRMLRAVVPLMRRQGLTRFG